MRRPLTLFFTLVLSPFVSARADSTTIADTSTQAPGNTGDFTSFPSDPSISGGDIAFVGNTSQSSGVYTSINNSLSVVANGSTKIPGGNGGFTSAPPDPCISGGRTAFFGAGSNGQQGIYATIGGLITVADLNTQIPNGNGTTFTLFGQNPSISGNVVAFAGSNAVPGGSATDGGIYALTNALNVVADNSTPIPGGTGNFIFTNSVPVDPCISGDNIAFVGSGSSGQQGVYVAALGTSTTITRVADTSTPIPGGNGNFVSVQTDPCISGNNVAFAGEGSAGQQGDYAMIGGNLLKIIDTQTPIPGGTGDFTFNATSSDPCIDGNNVLVLGSGSGGQEGIYLWSDSSLSKVVDLSDVIDGKTLESLSMGRESLSGDDVVFSATFTDGSAGIFSTTVPESGSIAILFLGAAATMRRRRAVAGTF